MQIVLVATPGTSPETVAQAITANINITLSIFRSQMQSKTPGGSLQARQIYSAFKLPVTHQKSCKLCK
jgi:hypothetical protein